MGENFDNSIETFLSHSKLNVFQGQFSVPWEKNVHLESKRAKLVQKYAKKIKCTKYVISEKG